MGTILALTAGAVPGLINLAETLFAKPQSGTSKMQSVMAALKGLIAGAVGSGQPAQGLPLPTDDALIGQIETILAQMKAAGVIVAPTTPTTVPGGTPAKATYAIAGTVTLS